MMKRSFLCALMTIIGVTSKISRFYSVSCFSTHTGNMRTTNSRRVPATRQSINIQSNIGVKATIRTSSSSSLLRGSNTHDNDNNKNKPTVGIIGGGIAGLSCARHLQYAYDVTVVS